MSTPLGIYLHFPYCTRRCPYCDFTLTTQSIPHERYLQAVISELKRAHTHLINSVQNIQIPLLRSLYFGGGTPSLWMPNAIAQVIQTAQTLFGFEEEAEITLEVNPSELTFEGAKAWRRAGVNRLSLGTQSFDLKSLQFLGRTHQPQEARRAFSWARLAGFTNINLDVMHGFQGQSVQEAVEDLNAALELNPEHISLYQLTVEAQTVFGLRAAQGEQLIEPEEQLVDIYQALAQRLQDSGRPLYEISNASLLGYESKHNTLYWTLGQYIGVGAGAHGRLIYPDGTGERWQNIRKPTRYINRALNGESLREEYASLNVDELLEEKVMVGLRLFKGFEVTPKLRAQFGANVSLQVQSGLMEDTGDRWRATPRGRMILNHLTWRVLLGSLYL